MADVELSPSEQIALALLRNTPPEIQKLSRPDGTINLEDLHTYFHTLSRKLEYAQVRRKTDYIDNTVQGENSVIPNH